MSKPTKLFACTNCDAQSPKWTGQCLECGKWGTVEPVSPEWEGGEGGGGVAPTADLPKAKSLKIIGLGDVDVLNAVRTGTGLTEMDRVLGGGLVDGSVTLIGGEPGIGKSTMALIMCARLAQTGRPVLYVSGEESAAQIKLRAERLKLPLQNLNFLDSTDCDAVAATIEKEKPTLTVIDSIQTLQSRLIPSIAGAQNQVRYAASCLIQTAKRSKLPILIIGHVTKDGQVAGPKTLEHLVDTVLSFEGERSHPLRIIRSLKNRFGPTDETGVFEMTDAGLTEIGNPSAYLLDERRPNAAGSAITCLIEGTRPVLVEVQALVQRTAFGYPTRRTTGFEQARLEMLLAVLGRHGGLDLSEHDVYVNIVGGLKIKERSADLAVAAAIVSAARGVPLGEGLAVWGEVGLSGEVRTAPATDRRLQEAANLGLKSALCPLPKSGKAKKPTGLAVTDVRDIGGLGKVI